MCCQATPFGSRCALCPSQRPVCPLSEGQTVTVFPCADNPPVATCEVHEADGEFASKAAGCDVGSARCELFCPA